MEDQRKNQASQLRESDLDLTRSDIRSALVHLPKLLLASSSPRRSEILRISGWPFQTLSVTVDESLRRGETAVNYVKRLALEKAKAAAAVCSASLMVGADTTVVIDEKILGKPRDAAAARLMLQTLQGRWHVVLTGIALLSAESATPKVAHESTEVRFAAMNEDEIRWYVETGEPMDKAGAYAIQGQGARFIEGIKGDYFNVMGLPLRLLYELVRDLRVQP